jgi:hypothetical protein
MTEPRRLLEDPNAFADLGGPADDLARQLLDVGRGGDAADGGPSPALQAKMWSGIEAALGPIAAGAASASGLAAKGSAVAKGAAAVKGSVGASGATAATGSAAGGATVIGASAPVAAPAAVVTTGSGLGLAVGTKIGLAGLFLGATFVTAAVVRSPEEAPPPAAVVATDTRGADPVTTSSPRPVAPQVAAPVAESDGTVDDKTVIDTPADEPPPAPRADASTKPREDQPAPAPAAPARAVPAADSSKSAGASNLVEEVAAVQKARTLLAQGSASQALAVLAELDKSMPRGSLGQERAVLTIESLAASGQKGKAAQLAKSFLAANPSSPYAERVRSYAQ